MKRRRADILLALTGLALGLSHPLHAQRQADPADVDVPPGYRVEVVAQGLDYLSDITFGPNGEMYAAVVGGHTYGTTPDKAPPARIIQILPGGQVKTIVGPDKVIPLDVIRNAKVLEEQYIGSQRVPTAYDIPEGIIMPITGVTYHEGKLYISHRSRYSYHDLSTGEFRTIIDDLPSWGEFLNAKPIFRDGKMYFSQATQGNLGPIGSHFMKVISIFNKPLAREVPCKEVAIRGLGFRVENGFTDAKGDSLWTDAYLPADTIKPVTGTVIPPQLKCNGAFYRANPDGTGLEMIAWGLRSNFGYRFSPAGRLVTTQNSCNPIPPRQVYDDWEPVYEVVPGKWYGWPDFCSSVPVTDPRFYRPNDPDYEGPAENLEFVLTAETHARYLDGAVAPPPPLVRLQPHGAAEGMVFGRAEWGMDPENEILVAMMGNIIPYRRDEQPGFKVIKVNLADGRVTDFMTNKGGGPASVVGNKGLERPIMVEWGPDGALYVVDFGIINITDKGMNAEPNSAVIWRVVRDDGLRRQRVPVRKGRG